MGPTCTCVVQSPNSLLITSFISSSNANLYNSLTLTLGGITNPTTVGLFPSLQISTYTAEGYLVDRDEASFTFAVTASQLKAYNIGITASSGTVYSSVRLDVTVQLNTAIQASEADGGYYLHVAIPT